MERSRPSLESSHLKNLLQGKMDQRANIPQPRMFVSSCSAGLVVQEIIGET